MPTNPPPAGSKGRIAAPAWAWLAARHPGQAAALAALMMVLFLTFLDNTIVSVALGSVQGDLHAGVTFLQWVVSAYALTFAGAMLAFGMVGDEFGRNRVMLIGVAIFCAPLTADRAKLAAPFGGLYRLVDFTHRQLCVRRRCAGGCGAERRGRRRQPAQHRRRHHPDDGTGTRRARL
jgi:hypothetical protein